MTTQTRMGPDVQSAPEIAAAVRQSVSLVKLLGTSFGLTTGPKQSDDCDNWELVGPALLFSAASCLTSILHLATMNVPRREQDASVLLRRLYEHAVDFSWIAIDATNHLKRWVADYYFYRLELEDEFVRLGQGEMTPEVRSRYEAYIAAVRGLPKYCRELMLLTHIGILA